MTDLLAARLQMAISLGFHILFAVAGIAMPVLMVIAERRWQQTGDPLALDLAKRWARGTAILFAVGAVSGTVLSFELGLLWPHFMSFSGALIGLPFSLEGFAFFTEAIFLGVYLYGWERVSRRAHLAAGVLVAVSGTASGIFVVIANAWMNAPTGFRMEAGRPVDIDPIAAMLNPAAFPQTLHMTLAAYAATGFVVAGIHAWRLLRDPGNPFHRRALRIAMLVAAPAAILQPLSGDVSARHVAKHQPAKLAAIEALFQTRTGAALTLGGWPDEETGTVRWGIEVPYALSLLAYHDPNAEVTGLEDIPRDEWPPVGIVHLAFQIMVGLGLYMAAVGLWAAWRWWRHRDLASSPRLLRAIVIGAPMGLIAIEAGWTVTEVGRQPWTVYGVLRTSEAVTPMPFLVGPLVLITLLYLFLGAVVAFLLYREVMASPTRGAAGGSE
jgi:cytochrome d ubiquinol oxidase subunit I